MAKLPVSESLVIDGPAGALQAILESPRDAGITACAVVCHPHPLHGGTMNNKVTHTLARSFVNTNMRTLRFNFRGVEKSDGNFEDGRGELHDALAAIDYLRRRNPGLPVWIGGFSFGAAIAIRAAIEVPAAGLVSVAPAVARFANGMRSQPACPWLIIQGDSDELVSVDETIAWVNGLEPGPELQVFEDTDHFFHGRLVRLRDAVEAFVGKSASGPDSA
jgi:alpha/beta superfamily hydrolase